MCHLDDLFYKIEGKKLCSIRVKAAMYGQIWSLVTELLELTWTSSRCFPCMSGGLFPRTVCGWGKRKRGTKL